MLSLNKSGEGGEEKLNLIFSQHAGEIRKQEKDDWARELMAMIVSERQRKVPAEEIAAPKPDTGIQPSVRHWIAPERIRPLRDVRSRPSVPVPLAIIPDERVAPEPSYIPEETIPTEPIRREQEVPEMPVVRHTRPTFREVPLRRSEEKEGIHPESVRPSQVPRNPAPDAEEEPLSGREEAIPREIPPPPQQEPESPQLPWDEPGATNDLARSIQEAALSLAGGATRTEIPVQAGSPEPVSGEPKVPGLPVNPIENSSAGIMTGSPASPSSPAAEETETALSLSIKEATRSLMEKKDRSGSPAVFTSPEPVIIEPEKPAASPSPRPAKNKSSLSRSGKNEDRDTLLGSIGGAVKSFIGDKSQKKTSPKKKSRKKKARESPGVTEPQTMVFIPAKETVAEKPVAAGPPATDLDQDLAIRKPTDGEPDVQAGISASGPVIPVQEPAGPASAPGFPTHEMVSKETEPPVTGIPVPVAEIAVIAEDLPMPASPPAVPAWEPVKNEPGSELQETSSIPVSEGETGESEPVMPEIPAGDTRTEAAMDESGKEVRTTPAQPGPEPVMIVSGEVVPEPPAPVSVSAPDIPLPAFRPTINTTEEILTNPEVPDNISVIVPVPDREPEVLRAGSEPAKGTTAPAPGSPVPPPPVRSSRTFLFIAGIVIAAILLLAVGVMVNSPHLPVVTPVSPITVTTTLPLVAVVPTTTLQPVIPQTDLWVRVNFSGYFTGRVGNPGYLREVSGIGDHFYKIGNTDAFVQVSVQKQDDTGKPLAVEVYKDGVLVGNRTITAPHGTVNLLLDERVPPNSTPGSSVNRTDNGTGLVYL
jgi:hypothetical protein